MEQLAGMDSMIFGTAKPCLFGYVEHANCAYNASEPLIFLGLGGSLAAVGLILAVYQLSNERWSIVLRIKTFWKRNLVFILSIAGLFFSLAAALITQVPFDYLPVMLTIPLFYEVISFLLLIAAPISLFITASYGVGIFTESNSRRFYEELIGAISKSDDKNTDAALMVLMQNFKEICYIATKGKTNEAKDNALAIIDVILSDSDIAKLLATKRLDALLHLIKTIEDSGLNDHSIRYGFQRVYCELLLNEDSFLYKQLDDNGLSLSSNVYEALFESKELFQRFDFYSGFRRSAQPAFSPKGVKVLTVSLEKLMYLYFNNEGLSPRTINSGIKVLSNIFGDLCNKASRRTNEDTGVLLSNESTALSDISFFFTHTFQWAGDRGGNHQGLNQATLDHERTARVARTDSTSHVNEAIAGAAYVAFEQLDAFEDSNEIYHKALSLLQLMAEEGGGKVGYRQPFEDRLWHQIAINVTQRYYPNVTRSFLTFGGFLAASDRDGSGWYGTQTERIKRLLYIDLKPLFDQQAEMANKKKMRDILLPDCMDYRDGKFYYRFGFGQGDLKEIPEPVEGAVSAFDGMNLENIRPTLF